MVRFGQLKRAGQDDGSFVYATLSLLVLTPAVLGHVFALDEQLDVLSTPESAPGPLAPVTHARSAEPPGFGELTRIEPSPDGRPRAAEQRGHLAVVQEQRGRQIFSNANSERKHKNSVCRLSSLDGLALRN